MKLIIAGSRTIKVSVAEINALLEYHKLHPTEIVCDMASGVDESGETYVLARGLSIKRFFPNWDQFGKSAGYRRNKQMAEYADALLLIWDGKSKGSGHMKTIMSDLGKPIYEAVVNGIQ